MPDYDLNAGVALANALGINTGLDQSLVDSIASADNSEKNKQRGYQLGADRANGVNQGDDFFNLSKDAYISKYGERNYYDTLQGFHDFQADNQIDRDASALAMDAITEVGRGAITPLVQIPAAIAGAVSPTAGNALSKLAQAVDEGFNSLNSYSSQFQKKAYEAKTASNAAESERIYQNDIANGMSVPQAEASKIIRDTGNAVAGVFSDPARLADITANGIGSLIGSGMLSVGANTAMRAGASKIADIATKNKITKARLNNLGRDAIKDALDYRQRAKAGMARFADEHSWAIGMGAMEGASGSVDTMNEIMGMKEADLYQNSPEFRQQVERNIAKGMSPQLAEKQAKLDVASSAANRAGILQGAIGLASGRLSKGLEKNIINPLSAKPRASALLDMGKETLEEAIQGGGGQFAQNLAIQQYADENKRLSEGVGQNIGESAIGGLTSAGLVQTPSQVSRVASDTAQGIYNAGKAGTYYASKELGRAVGKAGKFVNENIERREPEIKQYASDAYNKATDIKDDILEKIKGSEYYQKASDKFNTVSDKYHSAVDKVNDFTNNLNKKESEPELDTTYIPADIARELTQSMDTLKEGKSSTGLARAQNALNKAWNKVKETKNNINFDSLKDTFSDTNNQISSVWNKAVDGIKTGKYTPAHLASIADRLYKSNIISKDKFHQTIDTISNQFTNLVSKDKDTVSNVTENIKSSVSGSEADTAFNTNTFKPEQTKKPVSKTFEDIKNKVSEGTKAFLNKYKTPEDVKKKAKETFDKLKDPNSNIDENDFTALAEIADQLPEDDTITLNPKQRQFLKKSWMITNRYKRYREKFAKDFHKNITDVSQNLVDAKKGEGFHLSADHKSIREHIADIAKAVENNDRAAINALMQQFNNDVFTSNSKLEARKRAKETGQPQSWLIRGPNWKPSWPQTDSTSYKGKLGISGKERQTHVEYDETNQNLLDTIRQEELDNLALVTVYNELAEIFDMPKEKYTSFLLDTDSYIQEGNKIVQGFKDVKPLRTPKSKEIPNQNNNFNPPNAESKDQDSSSGSESSTEIPSATGQNAPQTPPSTEGSISISAQAQEAVREATNQATAQETDENTEAADADMNGDSENPPQNISPNGIPAPVIYPKGIKFESTSSVLGKFANGFCESIVDAILAAQSKEDAKAVNNKYKDLTNVDDDRDDTFYFYKDSQQCVFKNILGKSFKSNPRNSKSNIISMKNPKGLPGILKLDINNPMYKDFMSRVLCEESKSSARMLMKDQNYVRAVSNTVNTLYKLIDKALDAVVLNGYDLGETVEYGRIPIKGKPGQFELNEDGTYKLRPIKSRIKSTGVNQLAYKKNGTPGKHQDRDLLAAITKGEDVTPKNRQLGLMFLEPNGKDAQGNDIYKFNDRIKSAMIMATISYLLQMNGRNNEVTDDLAKDIFNSDSATFLTKEQAEYAKALNADFVADDLTRKIKDYLDISYNKEQSIELTEGIIKGSVSNILSALTITKIGDKHLIERVFEDGVNWSDRRVSGDGAKYPRIKLNALFDYDTDLGKQLGRDQDIIDEICLKGKNQTSIELNADTLVIPKSISHVPERIATQPTKEYEANVRKSKTPYYIDRISSSIFKGLGADGLIDFLGSNIEDEAFYNVNDLESIRSRQMTVKAALNYVNATVTAMNARINDPLVQGNKPKAVWEHPQYFVSQAIRTGRSQMISPVNPVGNKVLREMTLCTWSNLDLVNNEEHLTNFKLAIAQAFDEKIQYDLSTEAYVCPPKTYEIFAKLTNPEGVFATKISPLLNKISVSNTVDFSDIKEGEFKDLGKQLRSLVQNELSIDIYGKPGKINITALSLKALIEANRYMSEDSDLTNFRTSLYIEPDGITNGSINANILSYVGNITGKYIALLARGGVTVKKGFKATAAAIKEIGSRTNFAGDDLNYSQDIYTTNANKTNAVMDEFKNYILNHTKYNNDYSKKNAINAVNNVEKFFAKFAAGVTYNIDDAGNATINYERASVKKTGQTLGYGIGKRSASANLFAEAEKGIYKHISKVLQEIKQTFKQYDLNAEKFEKLSQADRMAIINNAFLAVDSTMDFRQFTGLIYNVCNTVVTSSVNKKYNKPLKAVTAGFIFRSDSSNDFFKKYKVTAEEVVKFTNQLADNFNNANLDGLINFTFPTIVRENNIDTFSKTIGEVIYGSARETLGDEFLKNVNNISEFTDKLGSIYSEFMLYKIRELIAAKGSSFKISQAEYENLLKEYSDICPLYSAGSHIFLGFKTERTQFVRARKPDTSGQEDTEDQKDTDKTKSKVKRSEDTSINDTWFMSQASNGWFGLNNSFTYPVTVGNSMNPCMNMGAGDGSMMKYLFTNFEDTRCMDTYDGCQSALDIASDVAHTLNQGIIETGTRNNLYRSLVETYNNITSSPHWKEVVEYYKVKDKESRKQAENDGLEEPLDSELADLETFASVIGWQALSVEARHRAMRPIMSVGHMAGLGTQTVATNQKNATTEETYDPIEVADELNKRYIKELEKLNAKKPFEINKALAEAKSTDTSKNNDVPSSNVYTSIQALHIATEGFKKQGINNPLLTKIFKQCARILFKQDNIIVTFNTPEDLKQFTSTNSSIKGQVDNFLNNYVKDGKSTVNGLTFPLSPGRNVILIENNTLSNPKTFLHEFIHAATSNLIIDYYNTSTPILDKTTHKGGSKYEKIFNNIEKLADYFVENAKLYNLGNKSKDALTLTNYLFTASSVLGGIKREMNEAFNAKDFTRYNALKGRYISEFIAYTSANSDLLNRLTTMKSIKLPNGSTAIRDDLGRFSTSISNSIIKDTLNKLKNIYTLVKNYVKKLLGLNIEPEKEKEFATLFDQYFDSIGWIMEATSQNIGLDFKNYATNTTSIFTQPSMANARFNSLAEEKNILPGSNDTLISIINNDLNSLVNIITANLDKSAKLKSVYSKDYQQIDNLMNDPVFNNLDTNQKMFVKSLAKIAVTPNLLSKKYKTQLDQIYDLVANKSGPLQDFFKNNGKASASLILGLGLVNGDFRNILNNIDLNDKFVYRAPNVKPVRDFVENLASLAAEQTLDAAKLGTLPDIIQELAGNAIYDAKARDLRTLTIGRWSDTFNAINEAISRNIGSGSQYIADKVHELTIAHDNAFTRWMDKLISLANQLINDPETAKERILHFKNQSNWMPDIVKDAINDMIGLTDRKFDLDDTIKLIKVSVQQLRSNYKNNTIDNFNNLFKDANLTDADHRIFYESLIKADIGSLTDTSYVALKNYFISKEALEQDIKNIEKQIKNKAYVNREINKYLTYRYDHKYSDNLLFNAEAIACRLNTKSPVAYANRDIEQTRLINKLMTLKSIEKAKSQMEALELKRLIDLMNNHDKAMSVLFSQCIVNRQEAYNALDAGSNGIFNYIKGWAPEETIDNEYIHIVRGEKYAEELLKAGYKIIDPKQYNIQDNMLIKDSYYMRADFNDTPIFNEGTLQLAGSTYLGASATSGIVKGLSGSRYITLKEYNEHPDDYNLTTNEYQGVKKIYNADGQLIAFQELPNINVLNFPRKDNNVFRMLGTQRGRQVEEKYAEYYNKQTVSLLYQQYKNDPNKDQYINVLESNDPVIKDAVSILPSSVKNEAAKHFQKTKVLMIRKDQINDILGMRSFSVGDFWTGNCRWSEKTRQQVVDIAEKMFEPFGGQAYRKLIIAEQAIMKGVSMARDFIIIKSIVVPMINAISNILQLMTYGISPLTTLKGIRTKTKELEYYKQLITKKVEYQALLEASVRNPKIKKEQLHNNIKEIDDEIKKLSIYPLIRQGEFATIADVGDNVFTSKGGIFGVKFDEAVDAAVNKLPKSVKVIGNEVFFTKDSHVYSFLEKSVQYGDFIAKAILYDHLIEQGKTQTEALRDVKEEFVDYDRSAGRSRQYLENMGLLWFYNYKLRIIKSACKMIKRNPFWGLLAMSMPTATPIGSIGLPIYDNLFTKGLMGQLMYSIGPQMGLHAPFKLPSLAIFS